MCLRLRKEGYIPKRLRKFYKQRIEQLKILDTALENRT